MPPRPMKNSARVGPRVIQPQVKEIVSQIVVCANILATAGPGVGMPAMDRASVNPTETIATGPVQMLAAAA